MIAFPDTAVNRRGFALRSYAASFGVRRKTKLPRRRSTPPILPHTNKGKLMTSENPLKCKSTGSFGYFSKYSPYPPVAGSFLLIIIL